MEEAIQKAYKFIDEHLCDGFTLDEIASFVGYSSQLEGSEIAKAFMHFGFTEAWKSGGWVYLAMSV